jgi:hypothetical protein
VLKWIIKKKIISSSPFALLIINVKIFKPIFKRNSTHLVEKKDVWKKQGLSTLEVWMFWTCNFFFDLCQALSMYTLQLMEKIPNFFMTIQTIMLPLWSFKPTHM